MQLLAIRLVILLEAKLPLYASRDSLVLTAIRLRAGRSGVRSRSQWPRGLRRGSTAVRLLGLWVRIPPRAWMFVLSLLYKGSSMEREGQKDLKVQNGSKGKTGQGGKNPGRDKRCVFSTKRPDRLWGPANLVFNG